MRKLLAFIAAPLRGANCFWGRIPRVSPGASIDRPSGTQKREPWAFGTVLKGRGFRRGGRGFRRGSEGRLIPSPRAFMVISL
jgi:hypothetical protein